MGLRSYPWGPLYLRTVLVVLAGTVLVEPVASSRDSVLQTGPNSLGRDPAGGAGLCPPGEAGKTHRQGGELICAFYSGPQCGLTVMTIPQGWQHHPHFKDEETKPRRSLGACQGLSVLAVSWFQSSPGAGRGLYRLAFLGQGPERPWKLAKGYQAPNHVRVTVYGCPDALLG